MALNIVRHDITRIKADAIVNSTNEDFIVGGLGVDASIHYAAGPKLQEALNEIGHCPVGSAVITDSFNIPTCKYIIHAVTPLFIDGRHGEKQLLESCYRKVLSLAVNQGCNSVAIPLLSAGAYGYPKEEAYRIATATIRDWIFRFDYPDLDISLVLYEKDAVDLGRKHDSGVEDFITDSYTSSHREALKEFYEYSSDYALNVRRERRRIEDIHIAGDQGPDDFASESFDGDVNYADVDLSFAEMCEWWCEKKGMKKGQFFTASNITRATFSNMKLHPDRAPKKNTVFACIIGLKLDIDQANDLLMRAGMTFSKHFPTDRIVERFVREGNYNIDEINLQLYEMDLMVLGYSRGE